jgi:hypothetical protein
LSSDELSEVIGMSAIHRGKFVTKLLEFKKMDVDESSTDPDPADASHGAAPAPQPAIPICM